MPALPTVSRPLPQAAPNPCSAGDAITSVTHFPAPPSTKDGCSLIGRSLTHNSELVSWEGSDIGEDLVQVTSEGCMWNGELEWDYVYTVSYSCKCPNSLGRHSSGSVRPVGCLFCGAHAVHRQQLHDRGLHLRHSRTGVLDVQRPQLPPYSLLDPREQRFARTQHPAAHGRRCVRLGRLGCSAAPPPEARVANCLTSLRAGRRVSGSASALSISQARPRPAARGSRPSCKSRCVPAVLAGGSRASWLAPAIPTAPTPCGSP